MSPALVAPVAPRPEINIKSEPKRNETLKI
jgi:hypothetical protein